MEQKREFCHAIQRLPGMFFFIVDEAPGFEDEFGFSTISANMLRAYLKGIYFQLKIKTLLLHILVTYQFLSI